MLKAEIAQWWEFYWVIVGEPGQRPESYWDPRIAEVCSLRPSDLGDLTSGQIHDAFRYSHPPR